MNGVLQSIKIRNFKAFQEEKEIKLEGRNLLIYGANGTGKSSVYWSLYTFLQSSVKTENRVREYFLEYDESDERTYQSLLNSHLKESDSHISLNLKFGDEDPIDVTISNDDIGTHQENRIRLLNDTSDFIHYKVLQNFYNFSNRKRINLWTVFERDIFPFIPDEGYENLYKRIVEVTKDIRRTLGGRSVWGSSRLGKQYHINGVNSRIEEVLDQIQNTANSFLKKHFLENKDLIQIELEFRKKFEWEMMKERLWREGQDEIRWAKLAIAMVVKHRKLETDPWITEHRPQSFFNEALLNQIAFCIRIGALLEHPQTTGEGDKLLVCDDMLISLDMSNRMKIIKVLLNTDNNPDLAFFDRFQKIFLTHDKRFYEIFRHYTEDSEWNYLVFKDGNISIDGPNFEVYNTYLESARRHIDSGNFEEAGNIIRKEAERLFRPKVEDIGSEIETNFKSLSSKISGYKNKVLERERVAFNRAFQKNISADLLSKLSTDFENDSTLTLEEKGRLRGLSRDVLSYTAKIYEWNNQTANALDELKLVLNKVLNPASHDSLEELYKEELQAAIDAVIVIKDHMDEEL